MKKFRLLKKYTKNNVISYLLMAAIGFSFLNYLYEAYNGYTFAKNYESTSEIKDILILTERLSANLQGAESAEKNYLLTQNEIYVDLFHALTTETYHLLETLDEFSVNNPQFQEQIPEIRLNIDAKITDLNSIISTRKNGSLDAAIEKEQASEGKTRMNRIKTELDELEQKIRLLIDSKKQAVQKDAILFVWLRIPIIVFIITILLSAIYAIRLSRNIRQTLYLNLLEKNNTYLLNDGDNSMKNEMEVVNKIIKNLQCAIQFIKEIGVGNYNFNIEGLNENNLNFNKSNLAGELLHMRDLLKKSVVEEQKRKDDDQKRNWTTLGVARFGELLRQNTSNLDLLSDQIIKNLVEYLNANQGGLFLFNDDNPNHQYLELRAAYAYNRKKFLIKEVELGEGLVGTCAVEGDRIYMTNLPEDYIEISSALGEATPRILLIEPLKLGNKTLGVLEIASFNPIEEYQIEFVEKIAQSIASTIATTKINSRTAELLEQSNKQTEALALKNQEIEHQKMQLRIVEREILEKTVELDAIFEIIDETFGAIELDKDAKIKQANYFFTNLMHFKHHETVGKPLIEILQTNKVDVWGYDIFWKQVLGGGSVNVNHKYTLRDGRSVWTKETYKAIKNANGEIVKILAIFVDATEVKLRELDFSKQLKQYQQNQEDLQEQLKKITQEYQSEKDFYIEQKNLIHALEENEGMIKEALLRSKESEIDAKSMCEDLKITEENLRKELVNLTSKKMEFERNYLHAERNLEQYKKNENELKANLEQIQKKEQQLREYIEENESTEKTFHQILNLLPIAIFWKDTKLRYTGCNIKFAQQIGLNTVEEIIGKTDFQMPWIQVAERYRDEDEEILSTKNPKENYSHELILPNGDRKWVNISKYPLFDSEGNIFAILGISQ